MIFESEITLVVWRRAGKTFHSGQAACWWSVVPSLAPDRPRRRTPTLLPASRGSLTTWRFPTEMYDC